MQSVTIKSAISKNGTTQYLCVDENNNYYFSWKYELAIKCTSDFKAGAIIQLATTLQDMKLEIVN